MSKHKEILKGTSIFGGLQVFNILIALIRAKMIAILLGPEGVGLSGLYQNAMGMITFIASLGLNNSGIKYIAESKNSRDNGQEQAILTFRILIFITGVFGSLISYLFAKQISYFTFNHYDNTIYIEILSLTVLLNQVVMGFSTILIGRQELKKTALFNIVSGTGGVLISYLFFSEYGLIGVVYSLLCVSILNYLIIIWFSKDLILKFNLFNLKISDLFKSSLEVIKLGFWINTSGIVSVFSVYYCRVFILEKGGFLEVGLYSAAIVIVQNYTAMFFNALTNDFYPKLCSLNNDQQAQNNLTNNQWEVNMYILAPLIMLFFLFSKFFIFLIYSEEFYSINNFLVIAMLSMFIKAISEPLRYLLLSKDKKYQFFFSELFYNLLLIGSTLIGYLKFGLLGVSIGLVIVQVVYAVVLLVINYKFGFLISRTNKFTTLFAFLILCFAIVIKLNTPLVMSSVVLGLLSIYLIFISFEKIKSYFNI